MSYKEQELLTVNEHLSPSPVLWSGPWRAPEFIPGSLIGSVTSTWVHPRFFDRVRDEHLSSSPFLWSGPWRAPESIPGSLIGSVTSTWVHPRFFDRVRDEHLSSSPVLWSGPWRAPECIPGSLIGSVTSTWVHPRFFDRVRVAHLGSSPVLWSGPCCSPEFIPGSLIGSVLLTLFCPIMCFYILSSMLWCSLWFLHYNYIRFFFTSSCLQVLFTLCAFICAEWCPTHIVLCFVFLHLVYPMLPVSLDCQCLIAPSVYSNVYLCIQFEIHYTLV